MTLDSLLVPPRAAGHVIAISIYTNPNLHVARGRQLGCSLLHCGVLCAMCVALFLLNALPLDAYRSRLAALALSLSHALI